MPKGGKSRVEIEAELAAFSTKTREKRQKRWYVCYYYTDKPHILKMANSRGHDEESAWEWTRNHIKKDGKLDMARLQYAKCVEVDDKDLPRNIRNKKLKLAAKKKEEEADDE